MSLPANTRFLIKVIGCKLNQTEAGLFAQHFRETGWEPSDDSEKPDVILIHSCTVTERADRDSRKEVARCHTQFPEAAIAFSGCMAELERREIESWPGVLAVIPQSERYRAVEIISAVIGRGKACLAPTSLKNQGPGFFSQNPVPNPRRARAQIKIQDGCDGECTYCRVRLARGNPISRPLTDILREARVLADSGFEELVLTGVNLGCWRPHLGEVLLGLNELSGGFRVRLSSLEPQHLDDRLIAAMTGLGKRFCPHVHLAVQSGDDKILRGMNRTYSVFGLREKIGRLRQAIPGISLGGDFIVGFPGESHKEFLNTKNFVSDLRFSRLHVFSFSPRPGTPAASFDGQWPERVRTARARELKRAGERLAQEFRCSLIGGDVSVVLETALGNGTWLGTTEHYERARISATGSRGQIANGRVSDVEGPWLVAEAGSQASLKNIKNEMASAQIASP